MASTEAHSSLIIAVGIACLGLTIVSADVQLSTDCPQSSFKGVANDTTLLQVDTKANCTCIADVGCAQWVDQAGTNVGPSCAASATLTFTAKKYQTFTCVEISNEQTGSNVSFSPSVIAAPTIVTLTANGQGGQLTFELCPAGANVTLVCQTPKGDAYESPWFNFYATIDGTETISPINIPVLNQTGNALSVSFRPAKAGTYELKCRAVNSYIIELYKDSSTVALSVREPPKAKPVITINDHDYKDGYSYQVKEDDYIFASCSVAGGSPEVRNVTLTCGDKTLTVQGAKAILEGRRAKKNMSGEKCTCTAGHVTGCYNLSTAITLDVTYSPGITNMTINGLETSQITVEEGSTINFVCSATGNPTPKMYIAQESPASTPMITVLSKTLNYGIKASCDHTDIFYCVADNGVAGGTLSSKQRSVQVYVKCPPQKDDGNPNFYEATIGKNAAILIKVQAYPNPDKFVLYAKTTTVYTSINKEVDPARYEVAYQAHVAPHGTVVLTLFNVKSEDFNDYTLDIVNGIKDGLAYSFKLQEATPDTLSPGAIAGIVVGATAVVVIIVIVVALCLCKKPRRNHDTSNQHLAGFDSFGKLGVENHGHYYSSAQFPMPNENPYQKPRTHQVAGYPVPKLPDDGGYVDVEDHYDFIPADSVYSESTAHSKAPSEVDYSGTLSSMAGKSIYSATTDNTYLPMVSSSAASDKNFLNPSKY